METNSNVNYGEDPGLLSNKSKKFVVVILTVLLLFLAGIAIYFSGAFGKKEDKKEISTSQIKVEKPKTKELEEKKINFEQNGKLATNSENASENFTAISGQEPKEKLNSNENMSLSDYEEVKKADLDAKPISKKGRENRKLQARIELANRQNKKLMRDDTYMYRQTQAEQEEARRAEAERRVNERTQNLILDQMEKANELKYSNSAFDSVQSQQINQRTKKAKTPKIKEQRNDNIAEIAPLVMNNTTAQFWAKETGFYNLNSKNSKQSYAENRGILAVVHGDADGIKVADGQEVKIRLLEPFRILIEREPIIIPMGKLISTIAKIGSERLFLNIEGIFWENRLHPVQISVYDIDGREGLNVPALLNSKSNSRLLNNLSNPISGGQYFMPTGNVAQQVGSSIAVNLAQNAMQTGAQYLRKSSRITKVVIRSNYKIILFNTKSKFQDEKQNIDIEMDE